jgi:3'(2'), 5'-bisphosphate nucleotidase|tara:strand:+ start:6894 stop:7724 length:831 start_codon:yes stop_codon:yes gene_type:complete
MSAMDVEDVEIEAVVEIAKSAGVAIMDVYEREYEIIEKADGSPVTTADHRAHDIIVAQLRELTPEILVVSEESKDIDDRERLEADRVWMVDPLDGTKEFIRRNGEFTVNIGLADHGRPVLGVVYCPSSGVCYFAMQGQGAWRQSGSAAPEPIQVSVYDPAQPRMVASRSHAGEAVTAFRQALAAKSGSDPAIVSMGSALKVCVVAEGNADVYPRLAPTSEWDTCASHCVLNEAGGRLVDCNGTELSYNRKNILNPWFVAMADPDVDWLEFCPPQEH